MKRRSRASDKRGELKVVDVGHTPLVSSAEVVRLRFLTLRECQSPGRWRLAGLWTFRTFQARSSFGHLPNACQSSKTGERTGSRPSAAAGGGARSASLEAGRSTV
jgi:hypothetical protein